MIVSHSNRYQGASFISCGTLFIDQSAVHFGSLSMGVLDDPSADISNDNKLLNCLSSIISDAQKPPISAMSSIKLCLQREAQPDAARKHSTLREARADPSPRPGISRASTRSFFCFSLTPAREDANRLACQFSAPMRARGVVPAGTAVEPFQNWQAVEIVELFARFSRFSRACGYHVCGRAHVRLRTSKRLENHGTLELIKKTYIYQLVSGSKMVLRRFRLELPEGTGLKSGGTARFFNKIGGGYSPDRLDRRRDWRFRGLSLARGAQKFWEFGRAALVSRCVSAGVRRPKSLDRQRARARGERGKARSDHSKNSGNAWVWCGRLVPVGRVMLEGFAQGRRNALFPCACRKPVGLEVFGGGARYGSSGCPQKRHGPSDRRAHPLFTPFPTRTLPRSLPSQTDEILDRVSLPFNHDGYCCGIRMVALTWNCQTGSGVRCLSPNAQNRSVGQAGRGIQEMRQRSQIKGVLAYVK